MNAIINWVIRHLSGVTSTQWRAVLEYVRIAAEKITMGSDKKAWVIDKMKNLGITGSVANFLVESAVALLKKQGVIKP